MKTMGLPARKLDELFTYGQYRQWPDDERWELIDGVAWAMSAPGSRHQLIAANLYRVFLNWFDGKPCRVFPAPFDVLLADDDEADDDIPTVVQPDLSVFCDRSKIREPNARGAPDLVIEILSPSTARKDINDKLRLYERHGVKEYWIVDGAARSIQILHLIDDPRSPSRRIYDNGDLAERTGRVVSQAFPGLEVDLERLFED
jgi:Uma2 family endonuclease